MKRAVPILAIFAGTLLSAAGCSKTDNSPQPDAAQRASSAQESVAMPASPMPRLPDPVAPPKTGESPSPMPGQANDHSSEAFKGGGKPDPSK